MDQNNSDLARSADVYYRSGQKSTVGAANLLPQQRHGRLGQALRAIPTPNLASDDNSADKYYRNGGSLGSRQPQGAEVPVAGYSDGAGDDAGVMDLDRTLRAATRDAVRVAVQAAIAMFKAGQRAVTIEVGEERFTQDAQTQLDVAEARGEITTAQSHNVRFSLISRSGKEIADRSFGKIEDIAASVPAAPDAEPLPDDFEAFVKGTSAAAPAPVASGSVSAANGSDGRTASAGAVGLSGLDELGD